MSTSVRVRAVVVTVALLAASLVGVLTHRAPAAASAASSQSAKAKAAALRKQVSDLQRQTAAAISNYDTVYAALGTVVTARLRAEQELDRANAALRDGAGRADGRIRALYQGGGGMALYASVLESDDLHDAAARWANISALVADDERKVDAAQDAVRRAAAAEDSLRTASRRQTRLEKQAADRARSVDRLLTQTQTLLAAADAEVRRLIEAEERAAERARQAAYRALVERQRQATADGARTGASGGYSPTAAGRVACPVGLVHSFVDTWGAPRSGGRSHEGTDVFAPRGSPAFAAADGVISRVGTNPLGGITLYLRTDAGDEFYYAHNERNLVSAGRRVTAGEPIALVGNSGNAITTPPHIHLQVSVAGGPPVNPYPFLKGVCG